MSTYRNTRTPSPSRSIRAPQSAVSRPRRSRQYRDRDKERGYDLPTRDRGGGGGRSPSRSRSRSRTPPRPRPRPRHGNGGGGSGNGSVTLLLCVFHSSSHNWSTAPVKFNPAKTNDKDLWFDIRDVYQVDLRKPLHRFFSFRHVTGIVPVVYSANGIPNRADVGPDFPSARALRHMYHHPEQLRTRHSWVDAFSELEGDAERNRDGTKGGGQAGLQFIEGLNPNRLGLVGIAATVAIVVVSIVWCVRGGDLQTVFTVMGFVLTLIAAQVALVALYFQIVGNDSTGGGSSGS